MAKYSRETNGYKVKTVQSRKENYSFVYFLSEDCALRLQLF